MNSVWPLIVFLNSIQLCDEVKYYCHEIRWKFLSSLSRWGVIQNRLLQNKWLESSGFIF